MNVQHLDVKVRLVETRTPNLEPLVPIFHRWVRDRVFEDLFIDVADYRHVPQGPGLLVVGHEGNLSLDLTEGVPGVRYIRKTAIEGDTHAALAQALCAVTRAGSLFNEEATLAGAFKLDWRVLDLRINDRLLAPNRPETFARLRPALARFFDGLVGPDKVQYEHHSNPRELFRVTVRSSQPIDVASDPRLSS